MKHNIVFEKNKYYATYRFYNTTRKRIRTVGFQLLYNQLVYNGFSYEGNNYKISLSEDLMKILLKIKKKCFEKILFQLKKFLLNSKKNVYQKKVISRCLKITTLNKNLQYCNDFYGYFCKNMLKLFCIYQN